MLHKYLQGGHETGGSGAAEISISLSGWVARDQLGLGRFKIDLEKEWQAGQAGHGAP